MFQQFFYNLPEQPLKNKNTKTTSIISPMSPIINDVSLLTPPAFFKVSIFVSSVRFLSLKVLTTLLYFLYNKNGFIIPLAIQYANVNGKNTPVKTASTTNDINASI